MAGETTMLIQRVREHEASNGDRAATENLLTEGYARALALEAESRRLQTRIGTLAAGLDEVGDTAALEIAALARRRAEADGELARLRAALAQLRRELAA
ncbi:MAG: hypothetical protein ACXWYS_09445 [Gaiellaceae bacterium]